MIRLGRVRICETKEGLGEHKEWTWLEFVILRRIKGAAFAYAFS